MIKKHQKFRIRNWDALFFVVGYHLLLIVLLPFFIRHFSWAAVAGFALTYGIGGMCITAGYHRLFSHKTFSASPVFEWLVLIGSTLALQWTALVWSCDHRIHHKHVDTDKDPYSIKKGFWYAHVLWLFVRPREFDPEVVPDLMKNPRVQFQHRYYLPLAIATNLGAVLIACLFMHPVTAFYAVFVLRVFAIHHSTWFINSLAHTIGSRTYARELSAVDNAFLALVTFGEGYHNYHHAYANDYRNGIRWWHFDPTKWLVRAASKVGLTSNLREVDPIRLQNKLVKRDRDLLLEHLESIPCDTAREVSRRLDEMARSFEHRAQLLSAKLREFRRSKHDNPKNLREEIRKHRRELRSVWKSWVHLTQWVATRYELSHAH